MGSGYDPNVRDEWKEEMLGLCSPNYVGCYIEPDERLLAQIDVKTKNRLTWKLKLVIDAAKDMASAMLKGSLKYEKDDFTVDEWFTYALDDATDTLNYLHLLKRAYELEKRDGLGPFSGLWDAWEGVLPHPRFDATYYNSILQVQLDEFFEHEDSHLTDKANNEIVDIATIAINWLRCRGLDQGQIAQLIRDRIATRHAGKAEEIRKKYARFE